MTIKTFDANRVGGGTFSLEQDSLTGEYKLKEVGFVKLPTLKLPEIEQAAYQAPTPYTPDPDADDGTGTGNTNTFVGGRGEGDRENLDYTGRTLFRDIQKEATGGDMMKQATTLSDNLNKFLASGAAGGARLPQGTFSAEAEDSLEDRQAISPEPQKQFASEMIAERKASQMGPGSSNPRRPGASFASNQRSVPEASQALDDEYYGFDNTGTPMDIGRRQQNQLGSFGKGTPMDIERRQQNQLNLPDKNLVTQAKDIISNAKPVMLKSPMIAGAVATMQVAGKLIGGIGDAIFGVTEVGKQMRATQVSVANSLGYTTVSQLGGVSDPGRIASVRLPDGSIATSPQQSLFIGMNKASGSLPESGAKRISTRNSKKTQQRLEGIYGKGHQKIKEFNEKTERFQKELDRMNSGINDKNISDYGKKEKATPISQLNPNEMRNVAETGNAGGDPGCFIKGTLITMLDGSKKPVEKVDLGDNVAVGGKVFAVGRFLNTELYDYKGIKVSGSHMVNEDGTWMRVRDTKHGKSLGDDLNTVYVFGSENRRILIDDILFTDYFEVSEQDQLINNEEDFFNNWKSYGNTINEHNVNTLNAN